MKLSLCVPHYNEPTEVVRDLLNSVKFQQNIDFKQLEVVIVNDGGDFSQLSAIPAKSYPFKLKCIASEHAGVSATRNKAFDASTGEYVMFCDVDDMFYNATGLFTIFNAIASTSFDVLTSHFMEERRLKDDKADYFARYSEVFVHGKVYRRQYLIDIDLRWCPSLTVHEDFYFNYLAIKLCGEKKHVHVKNPFYLWKWRRESICRRDRSYIYKTYPNMIDSCTEVVNQLLKRLKITDASVIANRVVYDCYFTMNKQDWLDQSNQAYRRITELRFKRFYQDFKDVCKVLSEVDRNKLIIGIKTRLYREGMFLEEITFEDWIRNIQSIQ